MFLSLSSILARFVVFVASLLVFYSPVDELTAVFNRGSGGSGADTVSSDTTSVGKKEEKVIKISISDRGIRVKSGNEGSIILEVESSDDGSVKKTKSGVLADSTGLVYSVKGSDIVRFGNDIVIEKDEVIRGSAVAIGGDIIVKGKVFGDVVAVGGDIELDSTAIVNGDVVTVFGELERSEDAVVRGEIAEVGGGGFFPLALGFKTPSAAHSFGFGLIRVGGRIVLLVVLAMLLMLVIYLLSDRMRKASEVVESSFLKSLGIGFVVAVVGFIVVMILAFIIGITIIGIPISILLLFSFAALTLLGHYVGAIALGEFVGRKFGLAEGSLYIKGLLGLFLLYILCIIGGLFYLNPLLSVPRVILMLFGKLLITVFSLAGLGAFVISRAGTYGAGRKVPAE